MKKVPLKAWPEECSMPKMRGKPPKVEVSRYLPSRGYFFDVLLVFGSGLGGGEISSFDSTKIEWII